MTSNANGDARDLRLPRLRTDGGAAVAAINFVVTRGMPARPREYQAPGKSTSGP
jgi:hypothetical protein